MIQSPLASTKLYQL